jgi:DNA-binding NarL/FixJ family response regulator
MLHRVSFGNDAAGSELGASAGRTALDAATENGAAPAQDPARQRDRPVRILVVDNREGFRSSMVQALGLIPDIEVAGEARSGNEAYDVVLTLKPDVVLLDLSMPGMDAIDAARHIRRVNPESQVVMLSAFDGPHIEEAALAAGAWGLVAKGTRLEDVVGVLLHAAQRSSRETEDGTAPL